jgi:hypothetical protein
MILTSDEGQTSKLFVTRLAGLDHLSFMEVTTGPWDIISGTAHREAGELIGRTIKVAGKPFTIVGTEDFSFYLGRETES